MGATEEQAAVAAGEVRVEGGVPAVGAGIDRGAPGRIHDESVVGGPDGAGVRARRIHVRQEPERMEEFVHRGGAEVELAAADRVAVGPKIGRAHV